LAALAVELERHFGTARDVEFAVTDADDDTSVRLFLLQSRPITSLDTFTDWELQHEFDTAVDSERDISTKANVG
jgi:phosphoenolpyruvate synthase/pyruvate phosphate dikinase